MSRLAAALVSALAAQDAAPRPEAEPASQSAPDRAPRSLLVITLDTTRRDFMGFHGRTPSPTPSLDRLAARSLVFEDAYTTAPITLPAHASLFTGLYPRTHGVHDNALTRVPQAARTLAEILRDHGYATGASVAVFVLDAMFGLDQGFSSYDAPPIRLDGPQFHERRADAMVDLAIRDVERLAASGPFFYWVHFFDPHFPYDPPGGISPPPSPRESPAAIAKRLYEGEIRFMDAQIGRLLDRLAEPTLPNGRSIADELVIVVAGDHGESLGDAREPSHGFFLFDPTVRIPLLIRDREVAHRRLRSQVSLIDVVPTVLALLGIDEPGLVTDGTDLSRLFRGGLEEDLGRPLLLESRYARIHYGWAPFEGMVWLDRKFVRSRRDELFLPGEERTERDETDNRFDTQRERRKAVLAQWERLQEVLAPPLSSDELHLAPEHAAILARLGYATGGGGSEDADRSSLPDAYEKLDVLHALEEVARAEAENDRVRQVALLRELVAREPGSAELHEQLGIALFALDPSHQAEAEQVLQRALDLEPRRSRSHFTMGLAAERRARALRQELKALRESGAPREELRAKVAEERRRTATALDSFRATLELEPRFPEAIERLARLLAEEAERAARAEDAELARRLLDEADARLRAWLGFAASDDPARPAVESLRAMIARRNAGLATPGGAAERGSERSAPRKEGQEESP